MEFEVNKDQPDDPILINALDLAANFVVLDPSKCRVIKYTLIQANVDLTEPHALHTTESADNNIYVFTQMDKTGPPQTTKSF